MSHYIFKVIVRFLLNNFYVLTTQVCKNGRVQHLDLLITYGADMNSVNLSGNTPLHICAMKNQVTFLFIVANDSRKKALLRIKIK